MKNVFALASVSALAGIVMAAGAAGCSAANDQATATPTDHDAGPNDAERDARASNVGEVGEAPPEAPSPASCATGEPVDATKVPYTKALRSPGACSDDDVKALRDSYAEQSPNIVSVGKWAESVSETCAVCVFTSLDAAAWGPLVVDDDKLAVVNRGGCVELASGKEACGRAYEQMLQCFSLACLPSSQGGFGRCPTQASFDACRAEVQSFVPDGPCADAYAAVQHECGSGLASFEKACAPAAGAKYVFEATIRAHCGGAAPEQDAGAEEGG